MAQKINMNSKNSNFLDEWVICPIQSEITLPESLVKKVIDDLNHSFAPIVKPEQESESELEDEIEQMMQDISFEANALELDEQLDEGADFNISTDVSAFLNGEKVQIERSASDESSLTKEQLAFTKQIEDLFELLELEKSENKSGTMRVYQTDSSPYRPWRFH